jgi:hypothetical protein
MQHIDGYVIYIDNNRPCKIKPLNMYTVDVEYRRMLNGDNITHIWDTHNKHILSIVNDKNNILDIAEDNKMYVVEVSLQTGCVKRIRDDRLRGNPDAIIDAIVRRYNKDKIHSMDGVWDGVNIRLAILINRTFKTFCYNMHIPNNSHVIDLGSGNGADHTVWKDKGYTMLCIEPSDRRFRSLLDNTRDNINVVARKKDMRDVMNVLKTSSTRYRYVTFMRSIGHINKQEIIDLLRQFKLYGIICIVIVTMIADETTTKHIEDSYSQYFNIDVDNNKFTTMITYSVNGKKMQYVDSCYTYQEWRNISRLCGYNMSVIRESDYMQNVYHINNNKLLYPCTTDACITLSNERHNR